MIFIVTLAVFIVTLAQTVEYVNYMYLDINNVSVTLTNNNLELTTVVVFVTVGDQGYYVETKVDIATLSVPSIGGVDGNILTSVDIGLYERLAQTKPQGLIGSAVLDLREARFQANMDFSFSIRDTNKVEQAKMRVKANITLENGTCNCLTDLECGKTDSSNCGMCSPTFSFKDGDDCSGLVPCDKRTFDPISGDPESPCGIGTDCYLEIDRFTCSTDCANISSNYEKKGKLCTLKQCVLRRYDAFAKFPCMDEACFLQPDGVTCDENCPKNYNKNLVTSTCDSRDCFSRATTDGRCDASDDDGHRGKCGWRWSTQIKICTLCAFDSDFNATTGECENFLGCALRIPNVTTDGDSAEYVCGRDDKNGTCYLDFNRASCSQDCGFSSSNYKRDSTDPNTTNRVCVLKPCSERTRNINSKYPCEGDNDEDAPECFLQPDNETCKESCPTFYTKNANGKCELQDCAARTAADNGDNCTAEIETDRKCGWVDGQEKCIVCGPDYDHAAVNGKCVNPKPCAERTPIDAAANACGSDDKDGHWCYLDFQKKSCSVDCHSETTNYKPNGDEATKLCVLKDENPSKKGGLDTKILIIIIVIPVVVVIVIVAVVIVVIVVRKWTAKVVEKTTEEMGETAVKAFHVVAERDQARRAGGDESGNDNKETKMQLLDDQIPE